MSTTTLGSDRETEAIPGFAAAALPEAETKEKSGRGWKFWAAVGGVGTLIVLALIVWGLYSLGGADQSALERFRDVAIIFIILLFLLTVVLLAAIVAVLGFLVFQIKDNVIPMLEELTQTTKRVRGTTEFISEEAVKPIIAVAGTYARLRAMGKTVTQRQKKASNFKIFMKDK
jgi:hypothetical protein